MHLLALRISGFLSLKPDAVLKHWASAKILRSKPTTTGSGKDAELDGDEEVCKLIVQKFELLGGADVSYADIAKRAWEVGRSGLATKVCASSRLSLTSLDLRRRVAVGSRIKSLRSGTPSSHDEGRSVSA